MGYGMVQRDEMNGTRFILTATPKLVLRHAQDGPHAAPYLLGKGGIMRARVSTQYRDCGLAENPRPHSHCDHSKAERNTVSLYACRATVLMLSKDNYIGKSVAEDPSRLEPLTGGA